MIKDDPLAYHKKNLRMLKNYVDDPNSNSSLKVDILSWMYDNLQRINSSDPKQHNKKYQSEVLTFLALIERRRTKK